MSLRETLEVGDHLSLLCNIDLEGAKKTSPIGSDSLNLLVNIVGKFHSIDFVEWSQSG